MGDSCWEFVFSIAIAGHDITVGMGFADNLSFKRLPCKVEKQAQWKWKYPERQELV
jgi:hypothetical protein